MTERLKTPPKWLSKDAKTEWRRLIKGGVDLSSIDTDVFCEYCVVTATIRRLSDELAVEDEILEGPNGGYYINPKTNLLINREKRQLMLMRELGFTPKARGQQTAQKVDQLDSF